MNFNPAAYVGAIVREVTRRDHRGKPAWVVIATRNYDTDIDDLWDALTSAERRQLHGRGCAIDGHDPQVPGSAVGNTRRRAKQDSERK